jgi:uncharacterized protein YkwD
MKKIIFLLVVITSTATFAQDINNVTILRKINDLRKSKSLDTLEYSKQMQRYAKEWSKYILKKLEKYSDEEIRNNHKKDPDFLHVDYNLRFDKALKVKEIMLIGENINLTVEDNFQMTDYVSFAFKCWFNSKSHYEIMTDTKSNVFAFDYAFDKKTKRLLCILVIARIEK